MVKCPWCGKDIPYDEYSNHIDSEHPNIVPADERKKSSPKSNPKKSLWSDTGEKRYHVKYMAKGTYKTMEVDLTRQEIVKFYQDKPYEQIISVDTIMTEEEANRHMDRARESD